MSRKHSRVAGRRHLLADEGKRRLRETQTHGATPPPDTGGIVGEPANRAERRAVARLRGCDA